MPRWEEWSQPSTSRSTGWSRPRRGRGLRARRLGLRVRPRTGGRKVQARRGPELRGAADGATDVRDLSQLLALDGRRVRRQVNTRCPNTSSLRPSKSPLGEQLDGARRRSSGGDREAQTAVGRGHRDPRWPPARAKASRARPNRRVARGAVPGRPRDRQASVR